MSSLSIIAELDLKSFDEWRESLCVELDDKAVGILRQCWNASLNQACEFFGAMEGVDYGAEELLKAE